MRSVRSRRECPLCDSKVIGLSHHIIRVHKLRDKKKRMTYIYIARKGKPISKPRPFTNRSRPPPRTADCPYPGCPAKELARVDTHIYYKHEIDRGTEAFAHLMSKVKTLRTSTSQATMCTEKCFEEADNFLGSYSQIFHVCIISFCCNFQCKSTYTRQNPIKRSQEEGCIFTRNPIDPQTESAELRRNKQKTHAVLLPGITTAAAILLNCRSKYINAHQVLTALTLKQSSAKRSAFKHLSSRFVCSSYQTVMQRQVDFGADFGADFDEDVLKWANETSQAEALEREVKEHGDEPPQRTDNGYQLIMDNADIVLHPRHTSREKHGSDLHMVQMIAVQNRVNGHHLPNDKPTSTMSSLDIAQFRPTLSDNKLLKQDWIVLIGNIISKHIPSLKWFNEHLPGHIQHAHMTELKRKSKIVNLGVLMESENDTNGIYNIMHHLHKYVPGHGTEQVTPVISAGDLLTCERESTFRGEQRNSTTHSEKLKGIVPVIADFHALANFYQVIWLHLYNTTSSGDKGTLYAARNFLEARRITSDPMRNINAAADLISQYTTALVIAASMKYFGIDSINDQPTRNQFQFGVHPDRSHYSQHDQNLPLQKDAVFNYSRTALSMGMLAYGFTDARQMGDGDRIIRLYKFLVVHFKAANKPKYSYQVLRLLAQVGCFLTPRSAYELKWSRFVNKTGQIKQNIEVDREIEHQNRVFKENCGGLRGKVTKNSIDRISRSAQIIDELLTSVNQQARIHKPSGKHPTKITQNQLDLAMELHKDGVFDVQPGRKHFHFPDFPSSMLSTVSVPDLNKWMKLALKHMAKHNETTD
ncbi:uncharacterized protein LOC117299208 [Asterias rubens]|uniref:uncharacterized protein LOC117299208 n=1 Tax=Asterias rubens TaxID=7604 RepID=UPI00145580C0|nr:uncharacterized protein LOC117299208 [Asterias rubens]